MEVSAEVERAMTAGRMFRGSRDFFLAYELLAAFHASAEVRSARAPSPIQSQATCAALALELALKARVVLDGGKAPSRGPDGHRYSAIFGILSPRYPLQRSRACRAGRRGRTQNALGWPVPRPTMVHEEIRDA